MLQKERGDPENEKLMELVDESYGRDPTPGCRRVKAILKKKLGAKVNHKATREALKKCCGMNKKPVIGGPKYGIQFKACILIQGVDRL